MNRQELIDKIIYWICEEGKNRSQVTELIIAHSPSRTSEGEINNLFEAAFEKLNEYYAEESDPVKVIHMHVAIYEHIYSYFKSIKHAAGANKALQAKERLLNLLKEGKKMTFKKSETVIHSTSSVVTYDTSKLTHKDQERMQELIRKITA